MTQCLETVVDENSEKWQRNDVMISFKRNTDTIIWHDFIFLYEVSVLSHFFYYP